MDPSNAKTGDDKQAMEMMETKSPVDKTHKDVDGPGKSLFTITLSSRRSLSFLTCYSVTPQKRDSEGMVKNATPKSSNSEKTLADSTVEYEMELGTRKICEY